MKQKLPEKYINRSKLLRRCLDLGLSASEINRLVDPMEGLPSKVTSQLLNLEL